ncbi:MAG: ATP-binding cassette domain-containing protein, partial [Betaproteobacteria bacterium]|nr:ATP-binding cassette domain-containing protein [Betaproteobacteria bacterium]
MFLQVNALQVHYPGRQRAAVDSVSLQLQAGQMGVLIGPSGCGKTTLLRAVAGLEKISAGDICIDGVVVSGHGVHLPPEERRIGMVFQDYALFPHLNVAQNIAFGLHRWPLDRQRA